VVSNPSTKHFCLLIVVCVNQLRRERFVEELESYAKQVDEFKTYGEMSEIPKYLKKAQSLDNKLQTASDKVSSVPLGYSLINSRFCLPLHYSYCLNSVFHSITRTV